jgi:RHS repeat-associated protein
VQNLTFGWNALGCNTSQAGPHGTLDVQCDLAGRRTLVDYPGTSLHFNYDYLLTGEVTKIRENGATSGVGVLASYAYDDLGNRTSLTFGNGVVQTSTFDPLSRLASLSNDLPGGSANDLTIGTPATPIAYNPASQMISAVRTGDAYAWTGHYNFNRPYTANGLNQHLTAGSASFTYDTRGNLTSDGTSSFCYSSENLLTSAGGTCAAPAKTLTYDPAMRLYSVAGAATSSFAYDGLNAITEYDGGNAVLRRFVFDDDGQPIVWYEGSSTTSRRFLSADERGSIVSATDASGALVGINRYDEYGIPQGSNIGRFGYTGQMWLSELGLQYSKARIYSPSLGRFLQTDPIGTAGGINLYGYVGNDPVNFTDPLGLCGGPNEPPCTGPDIDIEGHRRDGIVRINCPGGCSGMAPGGGIGMGPPRPTNWQPPAIEKFAFEVGTGIAAALDPKMRKKLIDLLKKGRGNRPRNPDSLKNAYKRLRQFWDQVKSSREPIPEDWLDRVHEEEDRLRQERYRESCQRLPELCLP